MILTVSIASTIQACRSSWMSFQLEQRLESEEKLNRKLAMEHLQIMQRMRIAEEALAAESPRALVDLALQRHKALIEKIEIESGP